jgi:hypothetical protein
METVYRAFDGTIFEDEWDCEQYERKKKCNFTLLNERLEPTDLIDDVWYMVLRNEDDIDYIYKEGYRLADNEESKDFRLDTLYYYSEEDQGFRSFTDKIRDLKTKIRNLENLEMRCATAIMEAEKEKEA